ncbi:lambda exonuclease family protein [Bradyrhizobium sp. Tv2a-2]|uniref:lambda exonuclease family protein n=1 Tax=Bradyrhizobium sp. Tv2a-2 TaxID=113395 RepID=UPI000427C176|nr:lambda exonuclease family protein [Bradyrhizobium sp. Tv2a-2]
MTEELIQGSEEWRLARCGSLGASRVADAIAKTKTGFGASRANLLAELACERLTGAPTEKFITAAMQHGTDTEPEARCAYEFYRDVSVEQVGIIKHPTIVGTHSSPDGLVGGDGLVEIKCCQAAAHLEVLLDRAVPAKYVTQATWQMACTGRDWCDLAFYNPSFPEAMTLFVSRVERDDKRITELELMVKEFLKELDAKVADLRTLYIERRSPLLKNLKASADLVDKAS